MNTDVEPSESEQAAREPRALDQIVADYCASADPLARLALLAELRAALDIAEVTEVGGARAEGASWETVGRLLGISKQAANKRFADRPDPATAKPEAVQPRPTSKEAWTLTTPSGRPLLHFLPTTADQVRFPRARPVALRSRLRRLQTP